MSRSIRIVNYLIYAHLRNSMNIQKLTKDWDDDNMTRLGRMIGNAHEDVAKSLIILKSVIQKEYKIKKCRHPKKMHDQTKDGQWYCMNCNEDIIKKE